MTARRDYQVQVAQFFESLRMDARVDEQVEGARGVHNLDVVVRWEEAGTRHKWLVECKRWNRRVSKERVAALAEVAQDAGADHAFLLCESGFQPGAKEMADRRGVTVCSLSGLRILLMTGVRSSVQRASEASPKQGPY